MDLGAIKSSDKIIWTPWTQPSIIDKYDKKVH